MSNTFLSNRGILLSILNADEKGGRRKMYKKVNTDLNFVEREHNTLKFWQDNQIFEKSVKEREGCPTYMFYDGLFL